MMSKIIMVVAIVGILTTLSAMIPDESVAGVDNAMRSLIGQMYAIDGIINVDTLLICIQLVVGFYSTVLTFSIFWFILSKIGNNE